MKTFLHLIVIFFALIPAGLAKPKGVSFDGVAYQVVTANPSEIKIIWKDQNGNPLSNFSNAAAFMKLQGRPVRMLMNGGIFEPGEIPSGLLIQNGKQLCPINLSPGDGNFFLKPNGIFLVAGKIARIVPSEQFPPRGLSVAYAVQSGPLLLHKMKIHPKFNANSNSRLMRNGVGITKEGKVIFLISKADSKLQPNLNGFATAFLRLGCEDALFLDGTISEIRYGETFKDPGRRYGSFIAVVGKPERERANR